MSPANDRPCRLDERLVADGLADSRSVAQRLIMAGVVDVDGQRVDKSSQKVRPQQQVAVRRPPPFVSRAGEKLRNALDAFQLDVTGARALDVGASTGGFTDCLLQAGAAAVVAVDVGYNQLHERLRADPRVTVLERTNARALTPQMLPYEPDLLVCDASFISLSTVLPAPLACMREGFRGIVLCKPQFEAGPARVGKGGIVRDEQVRAQVLDETLKRLGEIGLQVERWQEAEPRGTKGNVEYVVLVSDGRNPAPPA